MRIPAPNYTQTPNILFDDWLPFLSLVELRVLMIIMRKTFGWHKIRDRISLSQLEKLTGSKRSSITTATKKLEKRGLILKTKEGKNGTEETYYELIIIEDSNNSYQSFSGTPTSPFSGPTKETLTKEIKKNTKKKAPAVPPVTLNSETKKFEGISSDDMQRWQDTYPAVNVRKELGECLIWSLSTPRGNYRKSIDAWMRNKNSSHTTPFKMQDQAMQEVSAEEKEQNSKLAEKWENHYQGKGGIYYDVHAKSDKVDFILPDNQSYSVDYANKPKEFLSLCQKAIRKMNLKNLKE